MTESEIKKIEESNVKMLKEWKRLKKGCMEAVENIADACDMKKSDFMVRFLRLT